MPRKRKSVVSAQSYSRKRFEGSPDGSESIVNNLVVIPDSNYTVGQTVGTDLDISYDNQGQLDLLGPSNSSSPRPRTKTITPTTDGEINVSLGLQDLSAESSPDRARPSVRPNPNSPESYLDNDLPEPEKKNIRKLSIEKLVDVSLKEAHSDSKLNQPTYILADLDCLSNLVSSFQCTFCGKKSLKFEVCEIQGFSNKINLVCGECGKVHTSNYSSTRSSANKVGKTSSRPNFDVNKRAVSSFLAMGKGYAAVEQFSMGMGMTVMSKKTYYNQTKFLYQAGQVGAALSMTEIRDKVRKAYQELDPSITDDDIIEIDVSYDGSWHTRGFTSKNGVALVVDLLTGYIIDYVVLSKFCYCCAMAKKRLGENTPEYTAWKTNHLPECQANYDGSSPAMEVNAADILWKRSEAHKMRYTTLLSDGDAKTFNHLVKSEVYGPNIKMHKEECINHVGKRLGTALRTLVKSSKACGVTLGGKSYGSLKDTTITKLTNYYHNAISRNKDDVVEMKTAIFATLTHCMSTDEKPQHQKCPVGATSWCFHQRAVANGEKPGPHSTNISTPLSQGTVRAIMPVYQRMASDNLLERCKGRTQNANESVHSRIWAKCPKSVFASRYRVECAVIDTICEYNNGYVKANLDKESVIGCVPRVNTKIMSLRKDQRRLKQCAKKATIKYSKIRRKIRLSSMRAELAQKRKEGVTYSAGAFDSTTD